MVILVLLFLAAADGCGMTTHSVIAHRSAAYFYTSSYSGYDQIIQTYIDSVAGGAPFPDYLYTCGDDHDAGEEAHWPPFQAAAADYIRNRTKPWDNSTEKLVAFFFGVTSHYIADITWHGLAQVQNGYGFIETLGTQNYNCTGDLCSSAHSAADTGGEFVAAWQTNLTWFLPEQWYIPTMDLVNIYAMVNYTVTPFSIDECHQIFLAGSLAVKYLGEAIYREITEPSPWLDENYISFPFGGVDDMAVWSSRMWDRFAEWIEQGPPNPPPPQSNLGIEDRSDYIRLIRDLAPVLREANLFDSWKLSKPSAEQPWSVFTAPKENQLRDYIAQELRKPGSLMREKARLLAEYMSGNQIDKDTFEKHLSTSFTLTAIEEDKENTPTANASSCLFSSHSLEYLGSSLAVGDFNGDAYDDIVMGAHGYGLRDRNGQVGGVHIFWGNKNGLPNGTTDVMGWSSFIGGNATYGRFGFSVATLDFNLDGLTDFAVGCPTSGNNWTAIAVDPTFTYWGSVLIFFGKTSSNSYDQPDIVISSSTNYTFLGTSISTGDIDGDGNDDLIIQSPLARANQSGEVFTDCIQRGLLRGFHSTAKRASGSSLREEDAEWTWFGPEQFAQFGTSVKIVTVPASSSTPAVSLLLVSAPGYRSQESLTVGRVYAYTLSPPTFKPLFTLTGNQQLAAFGFSMDVGYPYVAGTPILAVSAPSQNNVNNLTHHAGSVWLLSLWDILNIGGDIIVSPNETAVHAVFESGRWGSRFGWSTMFANLNADNYDELVVSAPMHIVDEPTAPNRDRGIVLLWNGGVAFPKGIVSNVEERNNIRLEGQFGDGRFGSTLATAVTSGQSPTLIVGAPRSVVNVSQEMAGAVYFYESLY